MKHQQQFFFFKSSFAQKTNATEKIVFKKIHCKKQFFPHKTGIKEEKKQRQPLG